MRNSFIVLVFCSFILLSCNSGTGDGLKVSSTNKSFSQSKSEEIAQFKEALKETPYSLSKSELDDLKADGAISDEDYQELLALANSNSSATN